MNRAWPGDDQYAVKVVLDGVDGSSPDKQLEELISTIKKKYRKSAQWSYHAADIGLLNAALAELTGAPEEVVASGGGYTVSAEASQAMSDLDKLLAEQAAKSSKKETAAPVNSASAALRGPISAA